MTLHFEPAKKNNIIKSAKPGDKHTMRFLPRNMGKSLSMKEYMEKLKGQNKPKGRQVTGVWIDEIKLK